MYKLPELPENQRWSVSSSFNQFLTVKLQEQRWWGWKTIASSTGLLDGGDVELASCVDHILRRDYFAMLRREREERNAQARNNIPFGTTK